MAHPGKPEQLVEKFTLADYGRALRRGQITAAAVTEVFLQRIEARNPKLGAFVHVADQNARKTAEGVDALMASGVDLGPLMGVPVAVKDLFVVDGMPTAAGSRMDVSDLIQQEGPFIKALKRAGCIILGKTRTTEFALGTVNLAHPTPWNPCDENVHRTPGGSSGGSAVAVAAGLCGFAVGSDTGGSVRQPAACCGIVGHKTSPGAWPITGVFPLAPTLDTIGTLSRSVADAQLIFDALATPAVSAERALGSIRLAKPAEYFFDEVDSRVQLCFDRAIARLEASGVAIEEVSVPEAGEVGTVFARMVPAELIATLGIERFEAAEGTMDPVAFARARTGLEVSAVDYIQMRWRHAELCETVSRRMLPVDGWIMPTTPDIPVPVQECATVVSASAWNKRTTHNTRPANLFGQCGISIPIQHLGAEQPVGLQIVAAGGKDRDLLAVAGAIEKALSPLE